MKKYGLFFAFSLLFSVQNIFVGGGPDASVGDTQGEFCDQCLIDSAYDYLESYRSQDMGQFFQEYSLEREAALLVALRNRCHFYGQYRSSCLASLKEVASAPKTADLSDRLQDMRRVAYGFAKSSYMEISYSMLFSIISPLAERSVKYRPQFNRQRGDVEVTSAPQADLNVTVRRCAQIVEVADDSTDSSVERGKKKEKRDKHSKKKKKKRKEKRPKKDADKKGYLGTEKQVQMLPPVRVSEKDPVVPVGAWGKMAQRFHQGVNDLQQQLGMMKECVPFLRDKTKSE